MLNVQSVRSKQAELEGSGCCLDPSLLVSKQVGSKEFRCNVWEPRCNGSQGNMSSTGVDDIEVEELVRETREQGVVRRFDFYTTRGVVPLRGAVVLRSLGFGVITIVGIDPDQARVGDIAIEIAHSGFYTRAEVWVKVSNGTRGWVSISQFQTQYHYTTYLA